MIQCSFDILAVAEQYFTKFVEAEHALIEKIRMAEEHDSESSSRLLTVHNNVALIEIRGGLTNTDSFYNRYFGMTSYNEIRAALIQAISHDVGAVLLDINSPGGSVSGLADVANFISKMPMKTIAYTSGSMASAAYFLGSQANYVYAGDFAEVGSIGVVVKTYDRTKMLADIGVKPVRFRSGKLKATGDPDFKLSEEEKTYIQRQVNVFAEKFFKIVSDARGLSRPQMDKLEITTGKTFIGEEGQEAGLIDGIKTFDQSMLKAFDLAKKVDKQPVRSIRY